MLGLLKGEHIFLYLSRGGALLAQSVVFLLIAFSSDLGEFGRFSFLISTVGVVSVLVAQGGSAILLRDLPEPFMKQDNPLIGQIVWLTFIRLFFAILVLLGAISLIANQFTNALPSGFFEIAVTVVLAAFAHALLGLAVSVLRVRGGTLSALLYRDLFPFVLLGILYLASKILYPLDSEGILVLHGFSLAFCAVCCLFTVRKNLVVSPRMLRKNPLYSSNTVVFWMSSVVGTVFAQQDIIIARALLGDHYLGVYALFRRITNLISISQIVANWTVNVDVRKYFVVSNLPKLNQLAAHALSISFPIGLLLGVGIVTFAWLWLPLFGLEPDLYSITQLSVLILGQVFGVAAGANMAFAAQCNQESYALKARCIALFVGAGCAVCGGLLSGGLGIAVAVLVSIVTLNTLVTVKVFQTVRVWTSFPFIKPKVVG